MIPRLTIPKTSAYMFEAQVERSPDAIAVVFEEQKLTYRELNAKANQLAHHLQSLGVGPEGLVSASSDRSKWWSDSWASSKLVEPICR